MLAVRVDMVGDQLMPLRPGASAGRSGNRNVRPTRETIPTDGVAGHFPRFALRWPAATTPRAIRELFGRTVRPRVVMMVSRMMWMIDAASRW